VALIIATGSNLGDRHARLAEAKARIAQEWPLIAESRVYQSAAVDYAAQPDFSNQVLQLALPWQRPEVVMEMLLEIERSMGRTRDVPRGPRTIDIDILFWGLDRVTSPGLIVPHPRWRERSFVVRPLAELPFFHAIQKCFTIPSTFDIEAIAQPKESA